MIFYSFVSGELLEAQLVSFGFPFICFGFSLFFSLCVFPFCFVLLFVGSQYHV
jgi:hypothetical protein